MACSTHALPTADVTARAPAEGRRVSLGLEAWRRFRRHRLAVASAALLGLIILTVVLGPLWWQVPINDIDFAARLAGPSWQHPFGTDDLGQDLFARLLYGGRISLAVGLAAMLVAVIVGTIIGALAGISRGSVDAALMWLTDLFLSLPQLPLLVRAQFLSLREKEFVEAARALGASTTRQVVRHILPNALGPVIVAGTIEVASAIIAESTLSFLGLGFPPDIPTWGRLLYDAKDYLDIVPLRPHDMQRIRSKEIAIVFQEPMTSLNPVYTVGDQIAEVIRLHDGLGKRAALDRTVEMMRLVHIPNPERRIRDYPHQFSGGMRQRVMIAMALSCNPALLIADEPTTALDVTIQAQILDLLTEMKSRLGMAVLLITHAMGVVAETAQRVAVMYAGKVVEEAPVGELFAQPRHPYTQGLIRSIPRVDRAATRKSRLESIAGVVPSLVDPMPGCRFAPRCPFARAACLEAPPPLREIAAGHKVACVLYGPNAP